MAFGPLTPGAPADLVALRGNPFDDLTELDDVVFVMRGGLRVR
jgi:imidazolonepropionase-like amidohydrolase